MGAYLRGRWWWYKRTFDKRTYRRPLRIRKGQESMLSARITQTDEDIIALHFGLERSAGASPLFSEYRKKFLEAKKHKATAARDRQRLDYVGGAWPDLPLNFYTKAHVETLEKKLAAAGPTGRPSKPATINRYMELLRSLFNLAIEDGLLHSNPVRSYEPYAEEGTRRALSDEELRAVVAAAGSLAGAKNFRLRGVFQDLVLFALATGMRLSEILNLRRSWITGDVVAIPLGQTKSRRRGASAEHPWPTEDDHDWALIRLGAPGVVNPLREEGWRLSAESAVFFRAVRDKGD